MPANCFRSCAGCSRKWRKCLRFITWNDREYFVRELTLFRGTGGEYKTLVSVTGLQDVLVGKDGAPISDEAEAVDRKICYYFTDEEFLLPEERLVALAEDA